jgi:hypothetical protein
MIQLTDHDSAARLPTPRRSRLRTGIAADLVFRPWFDSLALPSIARWFFPLSRAWAAATRAGMDVERFSAEIPAGVAAGRLVEIALARVASRQHEYESATAAWTEAFFDLGSQPPGRLVAAERRREAAAHAWMATRSGFLPLHLRRRFPAVRWELTREDAVERRHGGRLAEPLSAFAPALEAPVTLTHSVAAAAGRVRWLRFPSRVGGLHDTAWARVIEPDGVHDPPTVIFLHGICVESELWRADGGRIDSLVEGGIRIIRPEGPWHSRRREAGWFGGEPIMARGPLGMLDAFEAWVGEVARLIAWARSTSRGPVAIGGISLGALTSQLAATAAVHWPAPLQPDALFLVGTTGSVIEATVAGSLPRALGVFPRLSELGWTQAVLRRWSPLVEPHGKPVMPPGNIVMVIGTSDDVTPSDGGLALAEDWGVPTGNLFLRDQGHFSVGLGLERATAPLARLAEILGRRR